MTRSRAKGTAWETCIVDYLRANGAPHAERRVSNGSHTDRGDLAGIPGVVVQAKDAVRLDFGEWLAEAQLQRANDRADLGVVWAKRRGKASPADAYVVMTGAALVHLLTEAGYINPDRTLP